MKAIIYTNYGQPDVLHLKEVETPIPGDSELLVKVMASTVNRTDCANLTAKPWARSSQTKKSNSRNRICRNG